MKVLDALVKDVWSIWLWAQEKKCKKSFIRNLAQKCSWSQIFQKVINRFQRTMFQLKVHDFGSWLRNICLKELPKFWIFYNFFYTKLFWELEFATMKTVRLQHMKSQTHRIYPGTARAVVYPLSLPKMHQLACPI